jgi:hypothetical protein
MANKKYQYCVAECWGKGFITIEDSSQFSISGFPGNIWQVNGVGGIRKTIEEAQAIVNTEVLKSQTAWDALPSDNKIPDSRPIDIILPE